MERRVVVTGRGIISPVGNSIDEFWRNLLDGRSGVEKMEIDGLESADLPPFSSPVKNFDTSSFLDRKEAKRTGRVTKLTIGACQQALTEAGVLEDTSIGKERIGVVLGTGIGGVVEILQNYRAFLTHGMRAVNPMVLLMGMPNALSTEVAIRYGFTGVNFTVNSACASSGHAMGDAFSKIREGAVDMCVTGGSEAILHPHCMMSFGIFGILSKTGICRPFDKNRDGIVLGEGSAVFVFEEREHAVARGANIFGEVLGYSMNSDAFHRVAPHPEGAGAAAAMRTALKNSRRTPSDIHLINAHATGTQVGDVAEVRAIKSVFGNASGVPVSANKAATGHLVGASAAVEFAATLLSLEHQIVPPTINHEVPDADCDIDCVAQTPRKHRIETAISNSFGFGGDNVSLVVTK